MGTTCSVLVLKDETAIIGHVGDSRIYKIDNNKIDQLTTDHTKVQEMLDQGILTKEEAEHYPSRSVLARALGVEQKVKVDIINTTTLNHGQTFILCSDGLAKVTKDEIFEIVKSNATQDVCRMLINLANERGGKDNVTVQVIKISFDKPVLVKSSPEKITKRKFPLIKVLLFLIGLLLLLAIGFQFRESISSLFNPGKKESNQQNQNVKPLVAGDESKGSINPNQDLISQADELYNNGRLEEALIAYKEILDKEPMHSTALIGVNKIGDLYLKQAEGLRNEKNFSGALTYYSKVLEIQPENGKVKSLIQLCEKQIQLSSSQGEANQNSENKSETNVDHNWIVITRFNPSDWSFLNLGKDQYEIDNNSIKFYGTSVEKKSIFSLALYDAIVSADINLFNNIDNTEVGFIFGYNKSEINGESYYLLRCQVGSNIILERVTNNSTEQIRSIKSFRETKNSPVKKLKIQCSGNTINVFNENGLLDSWKSPEKIFGKAGVYADKNVLVKFSNIYISGNN